MNTAPRSAVNGMSAKTSGAFFFMTETLLFAFGPMNAGRDEWLRKNNSQSRFGTPTAL